MCKIRAAWRAVVSRRNLCENSQIKRLYNSLIRISIGKVRESRVNKLGESKWRLQKSRQPFVIVGKKGSKIQKISATLFPRQHDVIKNSKSTHVRKKGSQNCFRRICDIIAHQRGVVVVVSIDAKAYSVQ